jgi:PKD repeat protein
MKMRKTTFLCITILCLLLVTACKKNNNDELANTFTASPLGMGSCEIKFSNQVTNATAFEWDFGDGTAKSFEPNPTHLYACPGEYSVKLTVTVDGNTSSETKSITVAPVTFKKKFALSSSLSPATVVRTPDMGYAIFGLNHTDPYNLFYFIKTDCYGNRVWEKVFDDNRSSASKSMCRTADGGYALFGHREQQGSANTDLYLVKIDSVGNKEWEKTYGGNSREDAGGVQQTADGGYVVFGSTIDTLGGEFNFYLVKTNATGQVEWEKIYGGAQNQIGYALITTPDGGYAMLGYTNGMGAGGYDFYMVKANGTGVMEWEKTFGGEYDDIGYSLENTTDGGYALLGSTQKTSLLNNDMHLIKTNQFGDTVWENSFDALGNEAGNSIKRTEDGGFILFGYTNGSGAGNFDFYLVKTNNAGTDEWKKTYGESTYDAGICAEQTSGCDGYILLGSQSFTIGLMKTDKNGNIN